MNIHPLDGVKSTICYHADRMKIQPLNAPPGGVLRLAEKRNFSKEISAVFYTNKLENFRRREVESGTQIGRMGGGILRVKFSTVPS
jgi:hypothetical protein